MDVTELAPQTFIEGHKRTKKPSIVDEIRGAECNMSTGGRALFQLTLSRSQYNLVMSCLAGTAKEKVLETAKLLALELNSQLVKHQRSLGDDLDRINERIEDTLDSSTYDQWQKLKAKKSQVKTTRKLGTTPRSEED